METPIDANRLEEIFKSIIEHASAKLVYGEPVSVGDTTILPVAKVRYGFGSGSGGKGSNERQGGGGGGGLVAKPVGVVEVSQAGTRFIPITSNRKLLGAVALGICLGFLVAKRRRN